jgi:hypothetical protein
VSRQHVGAGRVRENAPGPDLVYVSISLRGRFVCAARLTAAIGKTTLEFLGQMMAKSKSKAGAVAQTKPSATVKSGGTGLLKIKRAAGLSATQRQFNKLVQQVDQERRHLAEWREAIAADERRFADEYQPLQRRYDELQTKLVFALDQAHADKAFNEEDKLRIADIVCDVAGQLLAEQADDAVKQLYNKYSGGDYDTEVAEQEAAVTATLQQEFGVDVDRASPLEAAARIAVKWRSDMLGEQPGPQGEGEYAAALMAAYGARDVPALLASRREVEQLDQASVNALPDERLQRYNQVLAEQLAELRDEVENVEIAFKAEYDIPPFPDLPAAGLSRDLDDDLVVLEDDIEELEHDLALFPKPLFLKAWLSDRRDELYEEDDDTDFGGGSNDAFLRTLSDILRQRR